MLARELASRAAADLNLLKSLLAGINEGLPSSKSSVAINLLHRLLRLPAEKLSAVEHDLLALTGSDIPAVRDVIVSSLTAEWATYEEARKLAQEALDDPFPGVRNSATKVLRLLQNRPITVS